MSSELRKLKKLLSELFQLDAAEDLDFGMYRVLRLRRAELEQFLDHELTGAATAALGEVQDGRRAELAAKLAKVKQASELLGVKLEDMGEYKRLQAELQAMGPDDAREREVYSHLAEFFSRYYDEGDFISQRRLKADTYAVPYDGSEVVLHWANKDQYYVKSGEYFARYAFEVPGVVATGGHGRCVFRLESAESDPDNVKTSDAGKRRFVLVGDDAVSLDEPTGELVCRFVYTVPDGDQAGKKQDKLDVETVKAILAAAPTSWRAELAQDHAADRRNKREAGVRSVLQYHLSQYTAKNTRDYFVHKDLGSFLRGELDQYLKTEVFDLSAIEEMDREQVDRSLALLRAIRKVALPIVTFLAQLEDFQKALFLKKKMVVKTAWCVTLDRVPESFYAEIGKNQRQVEQWKEWYAIDAIQRPALFARAPGGGG